jgi:hypothetical protein
VTFPFAVNRAGNVRPDTGLEHNERPRDVLFAHLSSDESVRSERERAALAVVGDGRSDAGCGGARRMDDLPELAAVPGEYAG